MAASEKQEAANESIVLSLPAGVIRCRELVAMAQTNFGNAGGVTCALLHFAADVVIAIGSCQE